jgi:hypothetical protein
LADGEDGLVQEQTVDSTHNITVSSNGENYETPEHDTKNKSEHPADDRPHVVTTQSLLVDTETPLASAPQEGNNESTPLPSPPTVATTKTAMS